MTHVNKEYDSLKGMEESVITNSDTEPIFSNNSSIGRINQQDNQSIYQSVSLTHFEPAEKPNEVKMKFKIILLEQLLKGFSVFNLSFGLVVAVVYFCKQIVVNTIEANITWQWVGIANSLFIFFVVGLMITSKIFISKHASFIKSENIGNNLLFYMLIVLPACVSWFNLIFTLLRDITYLNNCSVLSDILLPLSRLVFLMSGVVIISDLINYRIESYSSIKFFFIYKFTAVLTFVTCINIFVFELLNDESIRLQSYFSQNSSNPQSIYCYGREENNTFVKINHETYKYFHAFSIIFSLGSVVLLIKPLEQFYEDGESSSTKEERIPILTTSGCHNSQTQSRHIPKYSSLVVISSIFIFLLCSFRIILGIMEADFNTNNVKVIEMVSNALPIPAYLICGAINIYMLKLLNENYHLLRTSLISKTPIYLIWISLFGVILNILRNFVQSLHYLQGIKCDPRCRILHIVGIVNQIENIGEAIVQSMMMDFLMRINWKCKLSQLSLSRIYYCSVVLISINAGNFATNYYSQYREYDSQKFQGQFPILIWQIFSTLSNPFILIFRIICPIFLFIFLNKMNFDG